MADVQFPHLRNGRDRRHGFIIKTVTGMTFEPEGVSQFRRGHDTCELGLARAFVMTVSAGVELDNIGANSSCRANLRLARLDEQRKPDTGCSDAREQRFKLGFAAGNRKPALGRYLLATFGNDAGGVGHHLAGDGDHLVGRRHFEIERQSDRLLEGEDVGIADMAPVLAKMRGDPVSARRLGRKRRTHRVGMAAAARVAHRRDVINIHAEPQVGIRHWLVSFSEASRSAATMSARLSFSGLRPARRSRAAASRLLRCRRQPSTAQ